MRIEFLASLATVSLIVAGNPAMAQPLSQKLKSESVASLSVAARERGSAVRGAVLFPLQKIGCANCHAPGNQNLLGPDLTQLGAEATDAYLVEALLHPSKTIRKGFETVTVVTTAGQAVIGRIVDQNAERIVLRDTTPERRLVTIASSDVDQMVPGRTSSMPGNLVDQLQDRGQFLDLVRYLMEIASTGVARTQPEHSRGGGTISDELQGLILLEEFNCEVCHRDETVLNLVPVKRAPDLAWSSGRIDPRYVEQFIGDPLNVKPGTTMPDVMSSLPKDERRTAAKEIRHYLASLSDRSFVYQQTEDKAEVRGRELFHSIGCVACHSPRGETDRELLPESSVPLGLIEKKYNVDGLVDFLKNPHAVRPSGRMPDMRLTHWEAVDISHYLLRREEGSGGAFESFPPNPNFARSGEARFRKLGCVLCHGKNDAASELTSLPLAEARLDRGCLSTEPGPWPRFSLNEAQRNAIRAAITREPAELNDRQQIAMTLTAFRCLNCHQRDELGGVTAERNPHFQTTNPNLGPQGRIPPTLTGVGAKLNPTWMRQVLVSGRSIRPYVTTRMPQYGADNVGHLVGLFEQVDKLPAVQFATFTDQKEMREAGVEMAGTGGLNCIVCHTFQLKQAANMPAVDLTEMAERLQKNWFYHYMRDPQRLSLNTVMPSFWPGGRAMRNDILDGNTNTQIEALWQYLLDGRQARVPRGLIQESLELLATDEAAMLRRSYQGIGKRGIGVGYPHQINIAFDAEQMRLAMIWKGKFADPGGVWRSQGHGTVRPLGSDLIRFSPGPDLDDADSPWVVDDGRPPQHRFKGYSLDEKQRPRFRYEFADVSVEDYSVDTVDPSSNQPFIRRTLSLTSSRAEPSKLSFRVANGRNIIAESNGVFVIDDSLRVRVDRDHVATIAEHESGKQLRVPLTVSNQSETLALEYRW